VLSLLTVVSDVVKNKGKGRSATTSTLTTSTFSAADADIPLFLSSLLFLGFLLLPLLLCFVVVDSR
jgi:hypothetical protein